MTSHLRDILFVVYKINKCFYLSSFGQCAGGGGTSNSSPNCVIVIFLFCTTISCSLSFHYLSGASVFYCAVLLYNSCYFNIFMVKFFCMRVTSSVLFMCSLSYKFIFNFCFIFVILII